MIGFACVRSPLWRSVLQGVGVLRSCLPASLFEHLSMDKARSRPTQWTTNSACSPCSHAHFDRFTTACVSSPTGLSSLACRCSRTWPFLRRLNILAHFFPMFGLSNAEVWIQKIGDNLPSDILVLAVRLNVCFTPRRSLAGLS